MTSRRQFFASALAASAGIALAERPGQAIEPIKRDGKSHIKLSIAAYSYRDYLTDSRDKDAGKDENKKGPEKKKLKPPMTLEDFIDAAAATNVDGVELTEYYFAETTNAYLAKLKGRCTRLGLDVSGTAIKNNFCTSDPAKLKEDIAHAKKWLEYSSFLGAKTMRVFGGKLDKGDTVEKAQARCVEALQECCDHGAKHGVYVALENHSGGVVDTFEQTLAVIKAVKHDWFGLNWDNGDFRSANPYDDLTKLAPYAITCQIKVEMLPNKKREPADLKRVVDILRTAHYRGYIALEYEAAEDPKTAVPATIEKLRKLVS